MAGATEQMIRAERVDFADVATATVEAASRFGGLLVSLETDEMQRGAPNMTWTVGDVAAHMLTIVRRGTDDLRRAATIAELAVLNDSCIAEVDTRDPLELTHRLAREMGRLSRALSRLEPADADAFPFPLHAGLTTNVTSALSYCLFDFLGHGWDIATATGRALPIDPTHAVTCLRASVPILGPWARATAREGDPRQLAVRLQGSPDVLLVEVGGGRYAAQNVEAGSVPGAADVDPVEAFLAVAGRVPGAAGPVRELAAVFEPI